MSTRTTTPSRTSRRRKKDPNRPVPNVTFEKEKTIRLGGKEIKLRQHRNYHSDEGDLLPVPVSPWQLRQTSLAQIAPSDNEFS